MCQALLKALEAQEGHSLCPADGRMSGSLAYLLLDALPTMSFHHNKLLLILQNPTQVPPLRSLPPHSPNHETACPPLQWFSHMSVNTSALQGPCKDLSARSMLYLPVTTILLPSRPQRFLSKQVAQAMPQPPALFPTLLFKK